MQTKAVYTTVPLRFGAYTPFMSLTQTKRTEILELEIFPLPTRIKISVQPHFAVNPSAVFHLTRLSVRLHFPGTLAVHGLYTYVLLYA